MKRFVYLAVILFVTMSAVTAQTENAKRTATVKDISGVTSDVTDLNFSGRLQKFYNSYNCIALVANPCDVAIPIDNIISIEPGENSHTVRYLWRGEERTITGKLFEGHLTGKGDFGNFKLHTRALISVHFQQPPKPEEKQEEVSDWATLTLEDGTQITSVDELKRHVSYYSTEGYLIGGSDQYLHYIDFRFLRGQSLSTLPFTVIKRIKFEGEKNVSVTLKNGKQASGTISTEQDNNIIGFTGLFEKGKFFVPKKRVKIIEFGNPEKQSIENTQE